MLTLAVFSFNAFQENTYIITNDKKQCWIVDPGMYGPQEINVLTNYIAQNGLTPQAVINTHAHIDHIFGVQAMKDKYNIPFSLHEMELPVLKMGAQSAALFGFEFSASPTPDSYIKAGQPLLLGDDEITVFHTPGHSPGSISFYYPTGGWVVAGDVLFNGGIGRTDLPGGNFDTLINSIRTHLFTLPGATKVYSGHGPVTTIESEMLHNPFLS